MATPVLSHTYLPKPPLSLGPILEIPVVIALFVFAAGCAFMDQIFGSHCDRCAGGYECRQ
jgi:hypothetical protein